MQSEQVHHASWGTPPRFLGGFTIKLVGGNSRAFYSIVLLLSDFSESFRDPCFSKIRIGVTTSQA